MQPSQRTPDLSYLRRTSPAHLFPGLTSHRLAALATALTTAVTLGVSACADSPTAPAASHTTPDVPSFSTGTLAGSGASASITSHLSPSQCMDVLGGGSAAGTRVGIYTCNGGSNQQFVWESSGEIRNGSMCLDASGGAGRNGDGIIIWPCHGSPNQHWTGTSDGQIRGINGRCLDIPEGKTTNGTQLILWDCHGGKNQFWDEHQATVAAPSPPAAPTVASATSVLAFMGAANVPTAAALQAKGDVYARYESDFASYADHFWGIDSTSFYANFYDRAMIYYVEWARSGNATYLDRANKLAIAARTYLENVNYTPPTYNMMIDGVALHALVTGDQRSATAVAKVADVMGNPKAYWSYVAGNPGDHDGDSRHSARVLSAVLDAYLLKVASPSGFNYGALLPDLERRILKTQSHDGAYRWPNQCGHNKPFMTGMLDDALIRYYTTFQADAKIVPAVKLAVDYMWNVDWVASANGFKYMDADCVRPEGSEGSGPTADLNNLISSGYAFVAKQTGDASYYTKGDAVFSGGVYGAWITGVKEFNQEYTASYRYLALRF